jgi:hypothetical protein
VFPSANYRVVAVHPRQVIDVTLAIDDLLLVPAGSASAVAGFAAVDLSRADASMVALSVDYQHATTRVTHGDACAAPAPAYPCSLDTAGSFRSSWWSTEAAGQDTVGRAFRSAPSGSYMTGDFEVLDGAPFQAARLIAFGLRVNQ